MSQVRPWQRAVDLAVAPQGDDEHVPRGGGEEGGAGRHVGRGRGREARGGREGRRGQPGRPPISRPRAAVLPRRRRKGHR